MIVLIAAGVFVVVLWAIELLSKPGLFELLRDAQTPGRREGRPESPAPRVSRLPGARDLPLSGHHREPRAPIDQLAVDLEDRAAAWRFRSVR